VCLNEVFCFLGGNLSSEINAEAESEVEVEGDVVEGCCEFLEDCLFCLAGEVFDVFCRFIELFVRECCLVEVCRVKGQTEEFYAIGLFEEDVHGSWQ